MLAPAGRAVGRRRKWVRVAVVVRLAELVLDAVVWVERDGTSLEADRTGGSLFAHPVENALRAAAGLRASERSIVAATPC